MNDEMKGRASEPIEPEFVKISTASTVDLASELVSLQVSLLEMRDDREKYSFRAGAIERELLTRDQKEESKTAKLEKCFCGVNESLDEFKEIALHSVIISRRESCDCWFSGPNEVLTKIRDILLDYKLPFFAYDKNWKVLEQTPGKKDILDANYEFAIAKAMELCTPFVTRAENQFLLKVDAETSNDEEAREMIVKDIGDCLKQRLIAEIEVGGPDVAALINSRIKHATINLVQGMLKDLGAIPGKVEKEVLSDDEKETRLIDALAPLAFDSERPLTKLIDNLPENVKATILKNAAMGPSVPTLYRGDCYIPRIKGIPSVTVANFGKFWQGSDEILNQLEKILSDEGLNYEKFDTEGNCISGPGVGFVRPLGLTEPARIWDRIDAFERRFSLAIITKDETASRSTFEKVELTPESISMVKEGGEKIEEENQVSRIGRGVGLPSQENRIKLVHLTAKEAFPEFFWYGTKGAIAAISKIFRKYGIGFEIHRPDGNDFPIRTTSQVAHEKTPEEVKNKVLEDLQKLFPKEESLEKGIPEELAVRKDSAEESNSKEKEATFIHEQHVFINSESGERSWGGTEKEIDKVCKILEEEGYPYRRHVRGDSIPFKDSVGVIGGRNYKAYCRAVDRISKIGSGF